MKITGIICEYNPLHLGHKKQMDIIRQYNPEGGIVCLMSGNYVQRGMPAVFDKEFRAKAAILAGADLVLELPVTAALSSAEGFADQGVQILERFCDELSFGAENADRELLMDVAGTLLSETFTIHLKDALSSGLSFPAARQKALQMIGYQAQILTMPNNILAIEYCKAILSHNSDIKPAPIKRLGNYHAELADPENPSATSLRTLIERGENYTDFIPDGIQHCFQNATIHSLAYGEKAILYRLRTMTDDDYANLPYGNEGLWRKLMKNARTYGSLEDIITATKSKRYTRTRLDRMVMCAFLGLTEEQIASPAPYARVLALNDTGREILLKARQNGHFPNIGEKLDHPYQIIENRSDDLYGIFAQNSAEHPGIAGQRRIYYHK